MLYPLSYWSIICCTCQSRHSNALPPHNDASAFERGFSVSRRRDYSRDALCLKRGQRMKARAKRQLLFIAKKKSAQSEFIS